MLLTRVSRYVGKGLPPAPGGGTYAAVTLDGQRWIFVFPAGDWADLTGRLWLPQAPAETGKKGAAAGG